MDPTSSTVFDTNLILNLVFGLIGVIGTIIGVVQWRSAKQTDRSYKYLLELAEKNIEKNISEEELSRKREDIKQATSQIKSLQEQIRREIPMEARKAVLKDRLYAEVERLSHTYALVVELRKQLNEMPTESNIPLDLMKSIESEISPEYIINEKKSNLKTYLTIVTTGAAIFSALIQSPLERLITIPLLLIGLPILFQLLKLSIPQQHDKRQKMIAQVRFIIPLGSGLISFGLSVVFFLSSLSSYSYKAYYENWGFVFLISTMGCSLVFFIMHRQYKRIYGTNRSEEKYKNDTSNPT